MVFFLNLSRHEDVIAKAKGKPEQDSFIWHRKLPTFFHDKFPD